jgi:hypothetical protein
VNLKQPGSGIDYLPYIDLSIRLQEIRRKFLIDEISSSDFVGKGGSRIRQNAGLVWDVLCKIRREELLERDLDLKSLSLDLGIKHPTLIRLLERLEVSGAVNRTRSLRDSRRAIIKLNESFRSKFDMCLSENITTCDDFDPGHHSES